MKLIDFVVCEDVREEKSGKITLVGVLGATCGLSSMPPSWPVPFRMALFIRLKIENGDPADFPFELQILKEGKAIGKINGNGKLSNRNDYVQFQFVMNAFPLPGPGEINFLLKVADQEIKPETILNIEVAKASKSVAG